MSSAVGYTTQTITDSAGYRIAVHCFEPQVATGIAVLLHGSIEDSRIFYSRSGRGLAPYLCQNGFRVVCPDFPGRGQSEPAVAPGHKYDQETLIHHTLPALMKFVTGRAGSLPVYVLTHSWGGVQWLAYAAHYGGEDFTGAIHFATKRRIGIFSAKRLFMVDVVYTALGELLCLIKGYLPAKRWGIGSQNEQMNLYRQTRRWVYSKQWKSPDGSADYRLLLAKSACPPLLFITGADDAVLGHPRDVERLCRETGSATAQVWICGKATGYKHNYGHINLLTHPDAPSDVFPRVLEWININKR